MTNHRISMDDWLLTESVRFSEERAGRRRDDESAMTLASRSGGSPDQRLVMRARALPEAGAVQEDIDRLRRLMRWLGLGLVGLGLVGGWLAARAGMIGREVDILLILVTLLALPTLMLLIWAIVMTHSLRRGTSGRAGGRLFLTLVARLAPVFLHSPLAGDVARAGIGLFGTPFGRWYLSTLSHLFWLAWATGALITLVIFFAVAQYNLSWGTTLLDDATVSTLIGWLASLPASLGLILPPDAAWIAGGREGELVGAERARWAHFVLAAVIIYGAVPRLLLALLCGGLARHHGRSLELDRQRPGYLRLMPLLAPPPPDPIRYGQAPAEVEKKPLRRSRRPAGPCQLIGLELEREASEWPPELPGIDTLPLGRADRRDQQRELLAALKALDSAPPALIVICSMLRTPDAGHEHLLNQLADAANSALILVIDEGRLLRQRGGDPKSRLADWQDLAARVGAQATEIDLDQPAPEAMEGLKRLLAEAVIPA